MESLEVSAKTVDEAVEAALAELGLDRSEVEIEVLQEGRSGILGWGGEDARIRVNPIASQAVQADTPFSDIADTALDVTQSLLSMMEVEASVGITDQDDADSPVVVDIEDGDLGILIGRRGQSLTALQYIVNFVVSRKLGGNAKVTVDVAGYRRRRQEELENLAIRVADLVKSSNRAITLESMPAIERRIIHIVLRDDPDVTTGSVGFGDARKVVISPR